MSTRKGQAKWDDKAKRWRISVQKDGVRRAFYSSNPSTRGKFEAERKADPVSYTHLTLPTTSRV